MDTEDKKKEQEEKAAEAMQEVQQEEIRNFADEQFDPAPNSFWGQRGTWWILGIAAILIIFLVIWVCFFYGPN